MTEDRSFKPSAVMFGGDDELRMLHALARAEARLTEVEMAGVGVEQAREIREAAYASALVFFTQGPT